MNSKIIKNLLSSVERSWFPKFWEKYKLVVGYTVAIALAAVFLLCFSFDWLFCVVSLIWVISFIWLDDGNVPIDDSKVIGMWCIFCFGLSGIIMQALQICGIHSIGVIVAGFVVIVLYRYIPMFSYYLKYNYRLWGYDISERRKTKFNNFFGFFILLLLVTLISVCVDASIASQNEDKKLDQQLKKEPFVPVIKISEEMYDGSTIYILEAKGQQFAVKPLEYPEVRNINITSQVRVIFDKHNTFYKMKCIKKIEFKNY